MSNTSRSAPQPKPTLSTTSPSGDPNRQRHLSIRRLGRETGLNPALQVDSVSPRFACGHDVRCRSLATCRAPARHDTTICHYTRIGGLFMLLFAQPLTTICDEMRQVDVRTEECSSPSTARPSHAEALGGLIKEHMARRGQELRRQPEQPMALSWGHPRQPPRNREHPRTTPVERGIKPQASKHAALFQLAATPRTRYWPTCSGSPPPLLRDGRPSPLRTWDNTPPLDAKRPRYPRGALAPNIACPPTVELARGGPMVVLRPLWWVRSESRSGDGSRP